MKICLFFYQICQNGSCVCIDKGPAQLIVTAFYENIEYLRSVISQLNPTCTIKVIDFICIAKVTRGLKVCIQNVRFELTEKVQNLIIQVNVSADPTSLAKEVVKSSRPTSNTRKFRTSCAESS